jgi:hypothetical protein
LETIREILRVQHTQLSSASHARWLAPYGISVVLAAQMIGPSSTAAVIDATPSDYQVKIAALRPGDTLRLSPGTYVRLTLDDINGEPDKWIMVEGPATGAAAVIRGESCCNTVQIRRATYLALRHLTIDSLGIDGVDGINAKDGASHDILIENNRIQGVGGAQQTVGISTKSPAWRWVVRGNTIVEPGTGMYFGDSDGTQPFIAGVIERNVVLYATGYGVQIKHQVPYAIAGAPAGPSKTIIRHNVFIKDGRPSPDGNRPSLLVGPFPDTGAGANDSYEIYGNFLFGNPGESLIQASGRLVIHDNILAAAGAGQTALLLTDHNGALKTAYVYNNTIFGGGQGIRFASGARDDHLVIGNAVFADQPVSGNVVNVRDNVIGAFGDAGGYFVNATLTLGVLDLYPRVGMLRGTPLMYPTGFESQTDSSLDFNGNPKGDRTYRGAYAGEGVNPGWRLAASMKALSASPRPNSPTNLIAR